MNRPVALIVCLVLIALNSPRARAADPAKVDQPIRAAIQRSIPFLEAEGAAWIEKRNCASCHQVPFMLWSLNEAERAGFDLNAENLAKTSRWTITDGWDQKDQDPDKLLVSAGKNVDVIYQVLLGRDRSSELFADDDWVARYRSFLVSTQQGDGSWKPRGQLPLQKRSLRETTEVATRWAVLSLLEFDDAESAAARKQALDWLADAKPGISTEWFATRLLLSVAAGERARVAQAQQELLALQHDDGGWGWLTDDPSDAFGTGVAVYALSLSESKESNEAIERARKFLIESQRDDGSWAVKSTKKKKKDKVAPTSTYWGTAWAVIGLIATLPEYEQPAWGRSK